VENLQRLVSLVDNGGSRYSIDELVNWQKRLPCQCSFGEPCQQCVRKGIECGGYQKITPTWFRDETKHVISKAQRQAHIPKHMSPIFSSTQATSSVANVALPMKTTSTFVDMPAPITNMISPAVDMSSPITDMSSPITHMSSPITDMSSPKTDATSPESDISSPATDVSSPATDSHDDTAEEATEYSHENTSRKLLEFVISTAPGSEPTNALVNTKRTTTKNFVDMEEFYDSESAGEMTLPASMNYDMLQLALFHFVHAFIPGSHYEYLPTLIQQSASSGTGIVVAATYATAMANLARDRQDGELMCFSRKFYIKAIRQVNRVINSKSKNATSNDTIVSTLVLALFETIALDGENSLKSWSAHTNGTMALIRNRGYDLISTDFGKKLYVQVSNSIRAHCVQSAIPPPPGFLSLDKKVAPLLGQTHPMIAYWPIVDHATELQIMVRGKLSIPKHQLVVFSYIVLTKPLL
jgi:Fungal specific transcription factor domain